MRTNCKNYTEPGGKKTVFNGDVEFGQGSNVSGLGANPLQPATAEALGGVKVGEGLAITEEGVLSAAAATAEALGGVMVGDGLAITEAGVLSVDPAAAVANCAAEDVAGVVTSLNAVLAALRAAGFMATES